MLSRISFLSLLFVLLTTNIIAQDFSIGMKDGISWSSISGRYDFANFNNTQIEKVTEHSFGIRLNYKLNKHLLLQTEVNIEQKGFDFNMDPDYNGGGYWGKYSIKYLTIPLIIQYQLGKKVKFYGYSGISFGMLLQANNSTSLSSTSTSTLKIYDYSYDPTNEFNKFELGEIFGLGIKIPLCDKVNFTVDSRYIFGLTKAAKDTDFNYNPNQWHKGDPSNF